MPQYRAPTSAAVFVPRLASTLLLALAVACGGGGGDGGGGGGGGGGGIDLGTGPADFPKVQGYYQRQENVAAISCTPQNPPAGGDIATGTYTLSEPVGFTQSGSKVSIVLMNYPGDPPDTGTVDMSGKVNLGFKISIKEKSLRQGRQFYVDIAGTFVLNRSPDGTKMSGTGSYENVLHEGAPTAPVFATCTRTSAIEMVRTGG
jgi:hypothetical protein